MPVLLEEPPLSPAGHLDNTFLQEGKKMLYSSFLVILEPQQCTIICALQVRVGREDKPF